MSASRSRFLSAKFDYLFRPERAALSFAFLVTGAALLSFGIALALQLHHPYWAVITACIVAQRTRGMTLSKGFYRLIGTFIGTVVAFVMIRFMADHAWLFVVTLALWVSFCAGLAHVLRRFRAYGIMLAGFTTSIVALPVFNHPNNFYEIAIDRVASVFIGGLSVVVVFALFSKSKAKRELLEKVNAFTADAIDLSSLVLAKAPRTAIESLERQLIESISELDDMTSYASSESLQVRALAPRIRGLIVSVVSMMSSARALDAHLVRMSGFDATLLRWVRNVAPLFHEMSLSVRTKAGIDRTHLDALSDSVTDLERIAETESAYRAVPLQFLTDHLTELAFALQTSVEDLASLYSRTGAGSSQRLAFHKDWVGAQKAFLQTALAVLVPGVAWLISGWPSGPLVLLITVIHTVIFATAVNPVGGILIKVKTAFFSFAAALLCHWFLLPNGSGLLQIFAVLSLVLIPGSLVAFNRSTTLAGIFFTADTVLLLGPAYPMAFDMGFFLSLSEAFFLGVLIPYFIFGFVLPVNPSGRIKELAAGLARDIEKVAREESAERALRFESRMHTKVARMMALLGESGTAETEVITGALAALDVGHETLRLKRLLLTDRTPSQSDLLTPQVATTIQEVLGALGRVSEDPAGTETFVALKAQSLTRYAGGESDQAKQCRRTAASLEEIAATVGSNRTFFERF